MNRLFADCVGKIGRRSYDIESLFLQEIFYSQEIIPVVDRYIYGEW